MNLAILRIEKEESPVYRVSEAESMAARLLELKGHSVISVLAVTGKNAVRGAVDFLKAGAQALIVTGDVEAFSKELAEIYNFPNTQCSMLDETDKIPAAPHSSPLIPNSLEAENIIFLLTPRLSPDFIERTAIPALNSKTKACYTSVVFRTFGLSAAELKILLKDCVRNKSRIGVRIVELSYLECEVRVRYSNKTHKLIVDDLIARAVEALKDHMYSAKDETLPEAVSALLKQRGQKVCVAESFTGGGVVRALIAVPGASRVVKEGIVSYSNESKMRRLQVEPHILDEYGAVSIETVYEMAANILVSNPDCAYAVATTGNAELAASETAGGPCAFFVAAGDADGIHIYRYTCDGDRNAVIEFGVKAALFRLYRELTSLKPAF